MESQQPLILSVSPPKGEYHSGYFTTHNIFSWLFFNKITPANPLSKSHKYTEQIPPSKYSSLYVSNAWLACTSRLLSLSLGTAPSSNGGSYLLLHGDLKNPNEWNCSIEYFRKWTLTCMSLHLYYNHTEGILGLWSCLLPPSVAGQLLKADPHKVVEPYKNKP